MFIKQNQIIYTNKNKATSPNILGRTIKSDFGMKIPINRDTFGYNGIQSNGLEVSADFINDISATTLPDSNLDWLAFVGNKNLGFSNLNEIVNQDISASVKPRIYLCFNNGLITISFFMYKKTYTEGISYIYDLYGDADNHIRIYCDNDVLNIIYMGQGDSITLQTTNLVDGEFNHVVYMFNTQKYISGTVYSKLYLNGTLVDSSSTAHKPLLIIPYFFYIGCDSAESNPFNGLLSNIHIDDVNWLETQAEALAQNFSNYKSIEYYYNDGAGNRPIIDESTLFFL
jgi:hypothetical protein